jgi:hypothetical protein
MAVRAFNFFIGALLFCSMACYAQEQHGASHTKLSPALAQRLYYGWQDSTDVMVVLKKGNSFPASVTPVCRVLHTYRHFVVLRIPTKQIPHLVNNSSVVFTDAVKPPKEELTTGYLDLAVNKLNYAHARFPAVLGNGILASVKEQQSDTADIDYAGRYVHTGAGAPAVTTHASIMATTLAGAGNSSPFARGAAPAALVTSTSFASLLPEEDSYYKRFKITLQNHSYGTVPENYYGPEAAAYDESVAVNPTLVHVFSAGNSGTTAGTGPYAGVNGWSNLTGNFKTAKNVIVVGAIDSFYQVAAASSKGPAFDGRVKPELVAFGEDGSSGAAALVSGTVALLQQAYNDKKNTLPPAALVKAVLLNSAEAVAQKHLSYSSGYGSLNGYNAVTTIWENRFFEDSTQHGILKKFDIAVPPNTARLKITLAWTDSPAPVNASKALVNDLDAVLKNRETGESWLPWVLNGTLHADSLLKDAVRKGDTANTVEQITIDAPAPGKYHLEITGRNISTGTQPFAIAYQMDTTAHFEWTFPVAPNVVIGGQTAIVRWQTTIAGTGTVEYTTNQQDWNQLADTVNLTAGYFAWAPPDTLTTARLRMRFSNGGMAISDTFVISKSVLLQVGFACADSFLLYWNGLPAPQYRLYNLSGNYLQPVLTTSDTTGLFKTGLHPSPFYSIAPVVAGREGLRSATINYNRQGVDCYFRSFYTQSQSSAGATFALLIGTYHNVAAILFQKREAGRYSTVQTIADPQVTAFHFTDTALKQGINTYRVQIFLRSGAVLYSNEITLYHFTNASVIIYPNPAPQHRPVTLITNKAGRVRITVFNAGGQLVQEQALSGLVNKRMLLQLAKGLYFIRITEDDGTRYTQKLMVY